MFSEEREKGVCVSRGKEKRRKAKERRKNKTRNVTKRRNALAGVKRDIRIKERTDRGRKRRKGR